MKIVEGQVAAISVASSLQTQLFQAQLRIHQLEADRQSFKKKLGRFVRKLGEERNSWQVREHKKIRAVIDGLKEELCRERRSRKKMELLNSKLVNELMNAKSSAKQFRQNYEEEKKARELMELVCTELAKKIAEDRAEVEALRSESIKLEEEVEEERRMLQMAEVWREERVQMKLNDAKLALENKHRQMINLITELDTCLMSGSASLDAMEQTKAKLIKEAAKAMNVKEIKEFVYEPPTSGDIYTILEEIREIEANVKVIEACNELIPSRDVSQIKSANSVVNDYKHQHLLKHSNTRVIEYNYHLEGCEALSHAEDEGSNCSLDSSDPSVNMVDPSRSARWSVRKRGNNGLQVCPSIQISEVCSASAEQPLQNAFSIYRTGRSRPGNDGFHKIISEEGNGRSINGPVSSVGTSSPKANSCEGGQGKQDYVGQWSSPELLNPHITRGMKGSIEWPRGFRKNNSKAKVSQARFERQKAKLCNVVKHRT